jgi:hypothetical protein
MRGYGFFQALSKCWAGVAKIMRYKRFGLSEQYFAIVHSRLLHAINYFGHQPLAKRPPENIIFLVDAETKHY